MSHPLVVWTVMEHYPFEGASLVSVAIDLETGMKLAETEHGKPLSWERRNDDEASAATGFSRYEIKPRLVHGWGVGA